MGADFVEFPKIARWSREVIVTEKIDGTNAQVEIARLPETRVPDPHEIAFAMDGDDLLSMKVGSRSRFLTLGDDHYGFARWCAGNAEELFRLGEGRHFGEWWGSGIQRRYGLSQDDKRFSLFNTSRWGDPALRPACCSVVPVLYQGMLLPGVIEDALRALAEGGSRAAPGFMDPEGVILFHVAGNVGFKKTLKKDEEPKRGKGTPREAIAT